MKISKLIQHLEKRQEMYGDLEVVIDDHKFECITTVCDSMKIPFTVRNELNGHEHTEDALHLIP